MTTRTPFEPRGVIPACLLPFDADHAIDEAAFRSHLRDVAAVDGISAVTVNAHSTEVYSDGSHLAAQIARRAEAGGASALLVFPSATFGMGGMARPEMAVAHFKTIADSSSLPLIAFQYPLASGVGYPVDTLL
jgi:4-hydroxy-tetrahydrodipicolinate synthase